MKIKLIKETVKLSKEDYNFLKSLDFSEYEGCAEFNDSTNEFTYINPYANIVVNEYIVAYGLDDNYDVTDYGIELYKLYDRVFL